MHRKQIKSKCRLQSRCDFTSRLLGKCAFHYSSAKPHTRDPVKRITKCLCLLFTQLQMKSEYSWQTGMMKIRWFAASTPFTLVHLRGCWLLCLLWNAGLNTLLLLVVLTGVLENTFWTIYVPLISGHSLFVFGKIAEWNCSFGLTLWQILKNTTEEFFRERFR